MPSEPIDVTGEVISPDHDNITPLFMRHMAAYSFFKEQVKGKKVLEIGFGEGYGTYYLAEAAREITGVDVSRPLVEHARAKYVKDNLFFLQYDGDKLPFPDHSFEFVVNSQVLEHIKDYMNFIRENFRVLKPGGVAVFATPNRRMMIDGVNPYHFKEFTAKELNKALGKVFPTVEVRGLVGSERYMAIKVEEQRFAKSILMLDFLRLRTLMPRFLLKPLYKMAYQSVNRHTEDVVKDAGIITEDDFSVVAENPDASLDLFGICRK